MKRYVRGIYTLQIQCGGSQGYTHRAGTKENTKISKRPLNLGPQGGGTV